MKIFFVHEVLHFKTPCYTAVYNTSTIMRSINVQRVKALLLDIRCRCSNTDSQPLIKYIFFEIWFDQNKNRTSDLIERLNTPCFFRYAKSGNEDLVNAMTKWVFQEIGVLRVGKINHHKIGESEPPEAYTVNDMVVGFITMLYLDIIL